MKIDTFELGMIVFASIAIGIVFQGVITPVRHDIGYVTEKCDNCEYKTDELYYKGSCAQIADMINLNKQREEFENQAKSKIDSLLSNYCPQWCSQKLSIC